MRGPPFLDVKLHFDQVHWFLLGLTSFPEHHLYWFSLREDPTSSKSLLEETTKGLVAGEDDGTA